VAGDRLTGSDKRALLLWVLAGIVGVIFAYKFYSQASPEASVNFKVSREEALQRAKDFVGGLGENVNGYRSSIVFDVDENAKTYLERELGLQQANQLMSAELNIWHWNVRFFRPEQQEEFHVRVNTAGKVVGYDHEIEESRAGASLDLSGAGSLAQNFFVAKLGQNPGSWELLPEQASSKKLSKRTDWSFTWEKKGFRAKEAQYRLTVSVEGDRIGGSEEFLKVPEAWERDYKKLRSFNDVLALLFTVPYLVILALAVRLGIQLTQRGETSWRGAILIGLAATGLLFAQNLNDSPLWGASYDTNQTYGTFLAMKVALALMIAIASALTITLVLPAAEPLYRASQPDRLRLGAALTIRGWRSKEFFSAAVVGISLAAVHLGYVTAFYLVARHFGAWAPQDVTYQDSVNTLFPWISGAAIGLLASTNEEFTFRLFAIPYLHRLTGSKWIAVIVPAFLWSFLHSNYAQEPPYVRGIEIGLMGIVAGLVMLRWGILATLIWHYTVDALLVGMLLIRSNNLYFKTSGIVVALAAVAPLAISAFSYFRRGEFEPDEELLNRAKPVKDISLESAAGGVEAGGIARRYRALTSALMGLCVLCLLAGGAILWRVKTPAIGDYLQMTLDMKGATAEADTALRQHGVNPDEFYHAAVFLDNTDPAVNEYLRQRIGIAALNKIYAKRVPGALWRVRYFKDSQAEEYAVVLRPEGTLHSLRHTLAEAAPGPSLGKEEAVARAEQFLRDEKHVDLSQWSLVDSDSEKRPHRLDYTLTWQEKAALEGATAGKTDANDLAHARIEEQVLGDEVTNYRTYIKIPEEWARNSDKVTLGRVALSYGLKGFVFLGVGLTALVLFLLRLKSEAARKIPWRRLMTWGAWLAAAYLAAFALSTNRILSMYQTTIPFKIMTATIGIGTVIGGAFYFGVVVLLFGTAYFFALSAFGDEELPSWTGMPRVYYRDALLIGVGGALGLLGLSRALKAIAAAWPTAHRAADASFGKDFDTLFPAASLLAGGVQLGLLLTALICLAGAFVAARVRQTSVRAALFVLAAAALVGGNWGSGADFARQFATELIVLGFIVAGARWVAQLNLLGYFLAAAMVLLFGGIAELLGQPNAFYHLNGYALAAGLVTLLAWPLVAWLRPSAGDTT
jgi:hypothetical protein